MTIEGSIWTFAGMTAAVGMGVVFVALFLLSTYMHFFKALIARLEARGAVPPTSAGAKRPPQPPSLQPVPRAGKSDADGARVAAATAVGLHLSGCLGAASDVVVAAIGTALALHRARTRALGGATGESAGESGWSLAGRMEIMGGRLRRQERLTGR